MVSDSEARQFQDKGSTSKVKLLDGVRVLVVDDNEDTCELVGLIMQQHGALVTLAGSAVQALKVLNEHPQDVLICDIGMPDEDGYLFMKRLRARKPEQGGHVPAIALTAFSEPEERKRILQSGFQMYVGKPAEPFDLVAAVCRLFGNFSVKP